MILKSLQMVEKEALKAGIKIDNIHLKKFESA
jgi:hypothetical protein